MTQEEFAAIAAACDAVLRGPGASLGRTAIPMLHAVSQHPGILARYAALMTDPPHGWRAPVAAVTRSARDLARAVRGTARSATFSAEASGDAIAPIDAVLVSHLTNDDLLDLEDDFYLGPLQRLLHERDLTSLLVLVNHGRRDDAAMHARASRAGPCARVLLPRFVSPLREASIWRRCLRTRLALAADGRARGSLRERVAHLAARHAMSAATAENLRLNANVTRLCRAARPRMVVTTLEGDASERMIFHAVREAAPAALCVGYQHTRLLAHSHAIKRKLRTASVSSDPDVILTLGEITHDALAAAGELSGVRLIRYGSHRRQPVAAAAATARPRLCLVLPDGEPGEAAILFDFAMRCAALMPDTHFVLRPHPGMGAATRRRVVSPQGTLSNVAVSEGRELRADIATAGYCLYRGSSAVFAGVLGGVKPLYLRRPGEMSFDPLAALTGWRAVVETPGELVARVVEEEQHPQPREAAAAREYCARYIAPIRPEAVDELMTLLPERRS